VQAHDDKVVRMEALRTLLAEKFPPSPRRSESRLLLGCPAFDQKGGLLRGAITEVCGSGAGGALFFAATMEAAARDGFFLGLIDAANCFEPSDWTDAHLRRLLWVICSEASSALKATDILLRDGNLTIVVLDLQMLPILQLQRIPASTWHRFQRVLEPAVTTLIVLTPQPLVEAAFTRAVVSTNLTLQAMHLQRPALWKHLDVQFFERAAGVSIEIFRKSA
jgi:hypothetical protein